MLILHLSVTEGRIRSSQNYIAQKTKAFSFQGIAFIKKQTNKKHFLTEMFLKCLPHFSTPLRD